MCVHEIEVASTQEFYDLCVKIGASETKGLFANESILKDAVVALDGGVIITSFDDIPKQHKGYAVPIDKGMWLIPRDYENKENLAYINHSCNPTLKRIGNNTFLAARNIEAGEELTIDYAIFYFDRENVKLECHCQSVNCRKTITGKDSLDPTLAKHLWPQLLPYMQKELIKRNIILCND